MKQLKTFCFVACFAAASYFLIFSFAGISIAEQTSQKDCSGLCYSKKQICYNINADKRICEKEYLDCIASCKPDKESSPAMQPKKKTGQPVLY